MKTIIDYTNLIKGYFAGASNLAPVEVSPSANAYAIGEPLMYNGKLYLAKTAIAVDDALVVGTNIEAADDIMAQLAAKVNASALATVATTGAYSDLSGTPTLGTAAAKDSTNAVTQSSTDLLESGAAYTALADKADTSSLATVATSGAYADLSGTPTLGTAASKDSTNAVTQSSTDLVESGAVYTDVNNKHKVTSFQVSTSGWTADTTSQSGTTLYKKSVSLSHAYVENPTVMIGAASGSVLPTTAQQTAYDLLQYATLDGTTLYLYASATPTDAFYINVEGVD